MDSLGQETDTSDMPDFDISDEASDDAAVTQEEAQGKNENEETSDGDANNKEQSSDDTTEGAHFNIQLENRQT